VYDYGARMYDPTLGRFSGIDPIAEDYYYVTPYNYAENEPIANIDLWGLQKFKVTDGKLIAKKVNLPVLSENPNYYNGDIRDFTTSKGRTITSYYRQSESQNGEKGSFMRLSYTDRLKNNCYGTAFGTKGVIMNGMTAILEDNYTKTNNPKVGSVGVLEVSDGAGDRIVGHAFEAIGENKNGDLLFRSDWLDGEIVEGTLEEVSKQIMAYTDKGYITNKKTGERVEFTTAEEWEKYLNSSEKYKERYTKINQYEKKDFSWYNPNK